MKKLLPISGITIIILFATITWFKSRSPSVDLQTDNTALSEEDKNRTQQFWQIYRQAGEHRLAGRLEKANESYKHALQLKPDHENTLYYFGSISFALSKFTQAEKAWKQLLVVDSTNARAHYQLGNLYLNTEHEEFFNIQKAEAQFRSALRINKEESSPHLRLGHVALINDNLQLAGQHFDAVLGSNFKSIEAYFLRGYVAWEKGNFEKALSMLGNARKHSKPVQPIKGVRGEGDTKPGGLFEQLKLSRRKSMFHPFFDEILKLDESKISHPVMEKKYQELQFFLNKIRKI